MDIPHEETGKNHSKKVLKEGPKPETGGGRRGRTHRDPKSLEEGVVSWLGNNGEGKRNFSVWEGGGLISR